MKIVELSNGNFALQKRRFPKRLFIDFANVELVLSKNHPHFEGCQGTYEQCLKLYKVYKKSREKVRIIKTIKIKNVKV